MSDSDVLYIDGDADAPILVIGEPPDEGAFVNGRALSRDERRFFDHVADSYGFRRDQFVFLPCAAPMPEDCVGDKDQSDHLALYRAEFLEKLHRCNPELIIPMGKHALRQLTGRAAQIGKARGQVQHVRGVDVPVLPMFGIRQCLWYPDNINIFVSDFNMVNLLELSDFDPACLSRATDENTDYQYTLDISEMLENRPPFVAVDTESTGLEWTNPDIRVLTVQLTTATGHARVIPVDERATRLIYPDLSDRQVTRVTRRVIAQLQALLEDRSVRKIGHNIKFDHHHIRESLGINIKGWFIDTQQLAFVVDDNMFEKSLDEVTRRWVPELAGYADCVVPDTEILTYDLKKKRAGDLQVGDKLCAFTAETDGLKAQRRKMEVSVVEGVQRLQRPTLKITTKSGRTTVVSTGHLMLCKKGLSDNGGGWRWRRADKLTVGSVLKPFPWHDQATDRDAGYMAGVFDGEGWCCTGKSRIGIAQRENACLDRVRRDLKRRRFRYTESQTSGRDVVNITIDGHEAFRALQIYGPHRLTGDASWVGCGLPTNYFKHDPIVSIEDAGVQEVVGLKTSTQTIIADGLLSHNSFNRTADKSNMLAELAASRETFLKYAGGDTDATYRSARALLPLAQEDETNWDAYLKIQLPALLAFADRVEPTGLYVDLDRLAELEVQVSRETVETERRVLSQIPRDLRRAHLRKGLRLSRRDLVSDALFTPAGLNIDPIKFTKGTAHKKGGDRVPSTSAKDHLIYFADEPLVEGIMRWSKLDKMRGTYVGKEFDPDKGGPTGFWKHVVRRDGVARIHPSFYLHRTKTGRSASANPNAQNFPKRGDLAKAFRSVFVAPPGYAIVECDLSQAELRIAACQANETTMIRLYNEGIDIHMNTAAAISGNPVSLFIANKSNQEYLADHIGEFKGAEEYLARLSHNERGTAKISDFIAMLRYRAKAVNFGFLYGMQWRKFKVYAKTDYGIDYTDEEAQNIRDMFFETYPGLVEWHNRTEDDVYADGKVYALHGAVRRLPSVFSSRPSIQHESVRQAINSPIQRFASDLGIMALWRLCRDAPDDLMPVAFIHDALVCYVPEEKAHEYGSYIRYYMESNPLDEWFGLRLPVPILADASIGPRLSDMDEVHVDAVCPVWFNSDADTEAVYVRL